MTISLAVEYQDRQGRLMSLEVSRQLESDACGAELNPRDSRIWVDFKMNTNITCV